MRQRVFWCITILVVLAAIAVALFMPPLKNLRVHRKVEALGGQAVSVEASGVYWNLAEKLFGEDCLNIGSVDFASYHEGMKPLKPGDLDFLRGTTDLMLFGLHGYDVSEEELLPLIRRWEKLKALSLVGSQAGDRIVNELASRSTPFDVIFLYATEINNEAIERLQVTHPTANIPWNSTLPEDIRSRVLALGSAGYFGMYGTDLTQINLNIRSESDREGLRAFSPQTFPVDHMILNGDYTGDEDALRSLDTKFLKLGGVFSDMDWVSEVSSVQELCLESEFITPSWSFLAKLPSSVTNLTFRQLVIPEEQLGHLEGLTSVEQLSFWNIPVGEPALKQFAGLPLHRLRIGNAGVTDEMLKHLADAPTIRSLYLGGNKITGEGLGVLSTLPSLKTVQLENHWLTKEGRAVLLSEQLEHITFDLTP